MPGATTDSDGTLEAIAPLAFCLSSIERTPIPPTFTCPLCYEEKPNPRLCVLSCGHKSCEACCVKWIEKAEASGQHRLPGCPWCRVPMTKQEARNFLGRPFQPKTATAAAAALAEIDELTLNWLREQTRQCPACGSYIERVDGCDAMECLCGFRFCYRCGSEAGQCYCVSEPQYYDNILCRHSNVGEAALPRAAANAQTGAVDFRRCIFVRQQIGLGEQIRTERQNRYRRLMHEMRHLDQPTSSAVWLFGFNPTKILNQIAQRADIRTTREERKKQWGRGPR